MNNNNSATPIENNDKILNVKDNKKKHKWFYDKTNYNTSGDQIDFLESPYVSYGGLVSAYFNYSYIANLFDLNL
ncbi:hypothetical protein COBT_003041, partial [Conglomerata obtusa]